MSKVLLGDVVAERRETCKGSKVGYPTVGLEHLTPEEITLTSWDDDSDNTFTKMFHKGDVLFGRRRAYLKKAAVAPFDGICSGDITVITANPNYLLPELLPFIIQNDTLFDFAVEKSAGSLSPRVKWEHLKNYEFSLPDMEKQHELSELLWAMDATQKSYQRLVAATDELVKSQFIEMFGNIEKNEKAWPIYRLGEKAEIGSSKRIFAREYVSSGIPFYRGKEIIELGKGEKPSIELYISETRYQEIKATFGVPQIGDILMTAVGTIGKFWIVDTDKPFYYKDGNVIYIRANSFESLFFKFVLEMLIANYKAKAANISAYAALPIEKIKEMPIIEPPRDIQEQFAAFVRQSDKSKFELEQALSELTATYKRIISEQLG